MFDPPPDVAARLGSELAEKRLRREQFLWRHDRAGRIKGDFVRGIVTAGLCAAGLWRRARREFLDIRVVENVVRLPALPRAFDGYRLLQITDLHSDIDPALVERVLGAIPRGAFDRCVLTGDYHDRVGDAWHDSVNLTLRLAPNLGPDPLAILGNHDVLAWVPHLESRGIRVLLNEAVPLEREGRRLWICGVDDPHSFATHDLRAASAGIPEGDCRILLSHSPETFREAAALGYALHLSGHTHGGQLCLPGGFAIIRRAPVPRRLIAGPWREGPMLGYTSRGTGGCGVPARWNCPPEITLHILQCA